MMLSSSTIFHYAVVPVFVIILVDYEAVLVRNYKLSKYANLDPNTFRPSFAPFGSNYALLDPCFASFWVHPPGECVSLQEAGGRPQSPWSARRACPRALAAPDSARRWTAQPTEQRVVSPFLSTLSLCRSNSRPRPVTGQRLTRMPPQHHCSKNLRAFSEPCFF